MTPYPVLAFFIWLQTNLATTEFSWRANIPSLVTTASGIIIVVLNQMHEGRKARIDRDKRNQEAKIDFDRRAQEAQQRIDERAAFIAEALAMSNRAFRKQLQDHADEIKHEVGQVKKELEANTEISVKAFDTANHVNEKILSIAEGRARLPEIE